MIIVHDLHKCRAYLCVSADKAKKGDDAGVRIALERRETMRLAKPSTSTTSPSTASLRPTDGSGRKLYATHGRAGFIPVLLRLGATMNSQAYEICAQAALAYKTALKNEERLNLEMIESLKKAQAEIETLLAIKGGSDELFAA
jgi:hypothetical protein